MDKCKPKASPPIKRIQILALLVLITLNITDIVTTIYGLSLGGSELNPLFPGESFITRESLATKICLPIIETVLFFITYRLCQKEGFSKGLWILNIQLLALIGIYAFVVGNNLTGIMRTERILAEQ